MTDTQRDMTSPPRTGALGWMLLTIISLRIVIAGYRLFRTPSPLDQAHPLALMLLAGLAVWVMGLAWYTWRSPESSVRSIRLAVVDIAVMICGGLVLSLLLRPGAFNDSAGSVLTAILVAATAMWSYGLGGRFAAAAALAVVPLNILAFVLNRVELGDVIWKAVGSDTFVLWVSIGAAYLVGRVHGSSRRSRFNALAYAAVRSEGLRIVSDAAEALPAVARDQEPARIVAAAQDALEKVARRWSEFQESKAFAMLPHRRWSVRMPRVRGRDDRMDDRLTLLALMFRVAAPWAALVLAPTSATNRFTIALAACASVANLALSRLVWIRGARRLLLPAGFAIDVISATLLVLIAAKVIPKGLLAAAYADIFGPYLWAMAMLWIVRLGPRVALWIATWWLGIAAASFLLNQASPASEQALLARSVYIGINILIAIVLHRLSAERFRQAEAEYVAALPYELMEAILTKIGQVTADFARFFRHLADGARPQVDQDPEVLRRRAFYAYGEIQEWLAAARRGDSLLARIHQLTALQDIRSSKPFILTFLADQSAIEERLGTTPYPELIRFLEEALSVADSGESPVTVSIDLHPEHVSVRIHAGDSSQWASSFLHSSGTVVDRVHGTGARISLSTELPASLTLRVPARQEVPESSARAVYDQR